MLIAVSLAPALVNANAVALACGEYATTPSSVDINLTMSGILKPSIVTVDTGQWVYFASDTVNKLVRFTGDSVKPTFEVLGQTTQFGSISGICLSPKDQSLYVVDKLNSSLFVIPCLKTAEPSNPKSGPYCSQYADYTAQFEAPLQQPSRCAVDKAGNIYVTQGTAVVLVNSTAFAYKTLDLAGSGALSLEAVTVDLEDFDVYVGDSAQGKIFRLPCNKIDTSGTQCTDLSTTTTSPSTEPVTIRGTSGLALNRGEGFGDFDLVVSDSNTAQIVSVSHPKSSTKSVGTTLVQLTSTNAPVDIAIDPIRFDLVIAEPKYTLPGIGALERLVCNDEVFSPSPSVGPQTTTMPANSTTIGPASQNMTGGDVFLLILFVGLVVYLGGGALFYRLTTQEWQIPNRAFWVSFGSLIRDGFFFAICCRRPNSSSSYGSYKASTDATDSDVGPAYENADTFHDDL